MAQRTTTNWDFQSKHVQELGVFKGNNFISSESIVLCAVPYNTSGGPDDSVASWIPIGLLENITIQQNKQLQSMFEIGSKKMFNIPGRTYRKVNLSRIMFNGPSIMKAVSQHNLEYGTKPGTENVLDNQQTAQSQLDDAPGNGVNSDYVADYDAAPNLYIDLASGFFNHPVHLGMVFKDSDNDNYGAFAMADCYVQSHQMSITGQQTVVMENISMVCTDIIPAAYLPTVP